MHGVVHMRSRVNNPILQRRSHGFLVELTVSLTYGPHLLMIKLDTELMRSPYNQQTGQSCSLGGSLDLQGVSIPASSASREQKYSQTCLKRPLKNR